MSTLGSIESEQPQIRPLGETVTDVLAFLKSKARRLHKQIEKGSPVDRAGQTPSVSERYCHGAWLSHMGGFGACDGR